MCITYKPLHPNSGRACNAHCSTHGDKFWAVARNVNENANKKPTMLYLNMFVFLVVRRADVERQRSGVPAP